MLPEDVWLVELGRVLVEVVEDAIVVGVEVELVVGGIVGGEDVVVREVVVDAEVLEVEVVVVIAELDHENRASANITGPYPPHVAFTVYSPSTHVVEPPVTKLNE